MFEDYYMSLDIETIPDDVNRPEFDETTVKLGNVKDKDKIKEKIEKARLDYENGLTKKMSVDSNYCRILSIGVIITDKQFNIAHTDRVFYGGKDKDDKEILKDFFYLYDNYGNPDIIGWNCKGFDIPVIWKRSILNKLDCNFNDYRKMTSKYYDNGVIDLMHIWNNFEYGKMSDCCKRLGIECKSGMDGSMIYDAYKNGQHEDIQAYNLQDCKANIEIAKRIL